MENIVSSSTDFAGKFASFTTAVVFVTRKSKSERIAS